MKRYLIALFIVLFAALSTASGRANVEKGEGVFEIEIESTVFECWNEPIYVYIYSPYTYKRVTTPSGNVTYTENIIEDEVVGIVIGLETGNVWTRKVTGSSLTTQTAKGDMVKSVYNAVFEPVDEGEVVRVHELYFVNQNASGDEKVVTYKLKCID